MINKKILFVIKSLDLQQKILDLIKNLEIIPIFKLKEDLKKEDFKDSELIISIGGDGTFLSASHFIKNQKILGVNSDKLNSEGALTSISIENLKEKLKEILNDKINLVIYSREEIKIIFQKKCIKTELALNETYLGNINPHHPSNYKIIINSKEETQRSSGVIISTGTGSTAWYKAMGGSPFNRNEEKIKFKVREPYIGRIHKAELLEGEINANEKIIIESLMNHCLVAIDSIRTYHLEKGDKIEISLGTPLQVIQ